MEIIFRDPSLQKFFVLNQKLQREIRKIGTNLYKFDYAIIQRPENTKQRFKCAV